MLIGVTLPSFRENAQALDSARRAERLGLDGVFVFDHLWPMGRPDRPALSAMPLLGAVAAATDEVHVGSLVARIGLLPDDLSVRTLASIDLISGGRFIAGLGMGDSMSAAENLAFGLPFPPVDERLESLRWCASRLAEAGTEVWIGGGSRSRSRTITLAEEMGVAVNLWEALPEDLAELSAGRVPAVTWAGTPGAQRGAGADAMADHLTEIATAGATWAVCVWPNEPNGPETLAEVAAEVRSRVGRSGTSDAPGARV